MSFIFGDGGAGKAAQATENAANIATAEQRRQFDISQNNLKPYLSTGTNALSKLAALYGISGTDANGNPIGGNTPAVDPNSTFWQSPDYQFKLDQGIKGLDASAAARGMLDSGATRKAAIKYAGNLASDTFGSYANRLASLAGVGQNATNQQVQSGQTYANAISDIAQNAGNNKASSYLAKGQAQSNGINGLFQTAGAVLPFLL